MEKNNLWTDEEVTLLKFYYSVKDSKTWREIADEMKEFTGVERTTTSLMSKIGKLNRDDLTKDSMKKLYDDMVINRNHGEYGIKFIKFVTEKFSKYYGDPNDIKEDYAINKLKETEKIDDIKECIVSMESYSEDEFCEFKLSDYIYKITVWTLWIIVLIVLVYVGYIYIA
jgi:hypothetical protein